jgi:serine/threonine protein kinase
MAPRYEIVEESAGQGGYGRIDKAMDSALERPVAIKTLDPLFRAQPDRDDVERFRREAKALARLSHPNIPAIYDVEFNPDADEFRIIFEWIEGETLREQLQSQGVLSIEEARGYFVQVCSALAHAHENDLVHRDIKPANIIATTSGACYLVDFGIALRTDDLTRITQGSAPGTPGYMSPEQEHGGELTPASDVFSLAVVLYECLAGTRPAMGGYTSLTLHNESFPPAMDELVRKSLDTDPMQRPQTAREFIDRLTAALRPHASFTAVLADGSLHEIQIALGDMSPSDYASLPPGQRMLIATRVRDLTSVDEERLRRAVANLLAELVRLAHTEVKGPYEDIVRHAFIYGYEKKYGDTWIGNALIRTALNDVARTCESRAHGIISKGAIRLADADDPVIQGWYSHDLRILLQSLLINPNCDDDAATEIGSALEHVNEVSH